ncbi:MAG: DNA translocase FtsK 4TM domain-containing protein, partial [Verrucomicrobiota bacterium]|nr:DNA translocase FtsK 4TM domain-containing protein [Verrucomicrobiota bacterium]
MKRYYAPRMVRAEEHHMLDEVVALALLGCGTLLFLALISYVPADVPGWFPLSSGGGTTRRTLNFIGPLGAILACSFYFFLGAAAYLIPAVMLGFGGAKLLTPSLPLTRRAVWAVIFVLTGACLIQLLPWSLIDASRLNLAGEGGLLGKWIGELFLAKALNFLGAAILLTCLYVGSLI